MPAYCEVLPEISMTRKISTLGDRADSLATLPLTKIVLWSCAARSPYRGERIWTLGSAPHAELAMGRRIRKSHSVQNCVIRWFIAADLKGVDANMISGGCNRCTAIARRQ